MSSDDLITRLRKLIEPKRAGLLFSPQIEATRVKYLYELLRQLGYDVTPEQVSSIVQSLDFGTISAQIDASYVVSGVFDVARIPDIPWSKLTNIPYVEQMAYSNPFNVAQIPDLSANKITSDVLALARIPTPLTGKDADTLDGLHGTSYSIIPTYGSYTGDGTSNRAIPHGMSRTPVRVVINNGTYDGQVSNADATYFYVTGGLNMNGYSYYWVALG
jgi:hypothetical protein